MRAAIYARVSTQEQSPENQLLEVRDYVTRRGWTAAEYVDHGVSGTRESRPALDRLLRDARRRRFDLLVVWRLDRLGRSLRHLVLTLDELQALGVSFITLGEGIDTSTPAGRLQLHVLSAIAEFERGRIRERVVAGLGRAKARGVRLGRPEADVPREAILSSLEHPLKQVADSLGVSRSTVKRWRKRVQQTLQQSGKLSPDLLRHSIRGL